jgi:glucose-6-phosphate dehydrogenase assembly protein OpcA
VAQDLRGQFVDSAISTHMPRRLITLAPTLDASKPLETLVAAYCPLPEEGGSGAACGDVVVLRGSLGALQQASAMVQPLVRDDLPCWVWWNSSLDEPTEMLETLAPLPRRLVIDTSRGQPARCLEVLVNRIQAGQAVNDCNWLRLRAWRESLAMVFDPPSRRDALQHVVQLDIDVEGEHPVKGLLLAAWIADRLGWHLESSHPVDVDGSPNGIAAEFQRTDGETVRFRLMPVPVGVPKAHPGAIVGLRLICHPQERPPLCVILCSESGGCMRLEAGGMAAMELAEEVVPSPEESEEKEMARLLGGGHDSTNPLLAAAAPLAAELLPAAFGTKGSA